MKSLRPCILFVGLILAGCQVGLPQSRARLESEGTLYLYLDSLAREAERLRAHVEGVSVLQGDGRELPLRLSLSELSVKEVGRQRLFASGPLPAGDYLGFSIRIGRASLRGEEGESALLVPEGPSRIDFRFTVRRREGQVISLALRGSEAVEGGFRFAPAFSAYVPDRPALGRMGFVANGRSNDITLFDKKSLQVFAVAATGTGPSSMALDQRARRLYVALSGEDAVEVLDIQSGRVTDRIRLTPGDEPVALALTRDGRTLLAANRGSSTVSFIDPIARVEQTKVPVGSEPRSIVVDQEGRRAFAISALAGTVSAIEISARSVIRAIPTDPTPVRGAFNRRGDRLYVVHESAPYMTVIHPVTMAVTGRFPIRSGMAAIKADPNTDLVYLAPRGDLLVGVHEPFSFASLGFLETGADVAHMTTDAEENTLYLVSPERDRVLVFHRIRRSPAGVLDVGDGPAWVSVMGEN